MQKKLIALAVAGLVSGSAFAQSNVTIYGVMDHTWESYKATGATTTTNDIERRTRLAANSSYIGFKGAESLGNGLTAVFQYESGILSDEAGAMAGGRDTMVALAGGFGTVAAGNLTGPVRAIGAAVDFNPGSTSAGFTGSMYGEVLGVKTGSDDRSKNAVAYISPTVAGGLYGVVAYQNGTAGGNDAATARKKAHAWTGGLVYANGPIFVGAGFINAKDPTVETAFATASTEDKLTVYRLSGKYTFPFGLSLSGLWDRQKYTNNGANYNDARRTAYMLGANYAFGANNVWLQYGVAKDVSGGLCSYLFTALGVQCGDTGAKQVTLGYSYSLSKRTMLHAFYTKVTNDKSTGYDFYVNGAGVTGTTATNGKLGADPQSYGLGLRHTF